MSNDQHAYVLAEDYSHMQKEARDFHIGQLTAAMAEKVEDILIRDYPELNHDRIYPVYSPNKVLLKRIDEILASEKATAKQRGYMQDLREKLQTEALSSYYEKAIFDIYGKVVKGTR